MKNSKLLKVCLIIIAIFPVASFAQTNLFPDSGNVGIGTTTPEHKLHVHSTSQGAFLLMSGLAPGVVFSPTESNSLYLPGFGLATSSGQFLSSASAGDLSIRGGAGKSILFGSLPGGNSNGVESMRITATGNVGIGTTSPLSKFHVNGVIRSELDYQNKSVKLGSAKGRIKLRNNAAGDPSFKTALAASTPSEAELFINYNGAFANGTRVMGEGLIVDDQVAIGGADFRAGYNLSVRGKILTDEVKVRTYSNWPDYVFQDNYQMSTLPDLEEYILSEGHLPGIPSAEKVAQDGYEMSQLNAKLLEKIEEITLHLIELNKQVEELADENKQLKANLQN
ncbi:MAG: hypothetical protein AAFQ94_13015 [Bacteroidota bacterium]